jgi:GNAT superfamily N-acetyltransferase
MEINSLNIYLGSYKDVALQSSILEEHWIELAKNKELMELAPNLPHYELLENSGSLFTLIAEVNKEVVGYSVNIVANHLHYSKLRYCHNDLIFISKPYRQHAIGGMLIHRTEKEAKLRGANLMSWHAKENTELAHYLPRVGCKVQEVIYSKEL